MRELLESGVHFGHQVKKWNPKMAGYIFTARNGVHILDLAKTVDELSVAVDYVKDLAAKGGQMVFLATKKQAKQIIEEEAKRCGALYLTERWIGGFLTNFEVVSKSIQKLRDLKEKREKGEFKNYTKKEQLLIDREIAKLDRWYGGVEELEKLPDAIFIVDCKHEDTAVKEAYRKGVPTVAICDTNCDPSIITYPIPGNDDAIKAIRIITQAIADSYLEGKQIWGKRPKEETNSIESGVKSEKLEVEKEVKENKALNAKSLTTEAK